MIDRETHGWSRVLVAEGIAPTLHRIAPTIDVAWQLAPRVRLTTGYGDLIGGSGDDSTGRVSPGIAF